MGRCYRAGLGLDQAVPQRGSEEPVGPLSVGTWNGVLVLLLCCETDGLVRCRAMCSQPPCRLGAIHGRAVAESARPLSAG
jgi:hypothetical protein